MIIPEREAQQKYVIWNFTVLALHLILLKFRG
jgi:hypothetical protein